MFFVLSGYLVCGRMIQRVFAGTFDMKRYISDRISRIYTPLLPAIMLTAIAGVALGNADVLASSFGSLISLQGTFFKVPASNGPLWSLTYEVWFYVIAGTIPLALKKNWTAALLVVSLAAIVFAQLKAYYLFIWLFGALVYPVRLRIRAQESHFRGFEHYFNADRPSNVAAWNSRDASCHPVG